MRDLRIRLVRPGRRTVLTVLAALLVTHPVPSEGQDSTETYRQEIESWRTGRVDALTSDSGWLTLVGLTWLEEGESRLGSATDNEVLYPAGRAPAYVGSIFVKDSDARIEVANGVELVHEGAPVRSMNLAADITGAPTVLELGDVTFHLINRNGRLAVRMKDPGNLARKAFQGIESWPIDASWRLEARLEKHDPPRTVPVPTVLGAVSQQPSPGTVVFERDGEIHRIDALEGSNSEELFLIFADGTTGRESYGGGRYIYVAVDADGAIDLEFNKAYNPPCAFTAYATCPLPPRQNRLSLRVEAGEKTYTGEH